MTREEEIRGRLSKYIGSDLTYNATSTVAAEFERLHARDDDLAVRDADTRAMVNDLRERFDATRDIVKEGPAPAPSAPGPVEAVVEAARAIVAAAAGYTSADERIYWRSIGVDGARLVALRAALAAYDAAPPAPAPESAEGDTLPIGPIAVAFWHGATWATSPSRRFGETVEAMANRYARDTAEAASPAPEPVGAEELARALADVEGHTWEKMFDSERQHYTTRAKRFADRFIILRKPKEG